MAVSVPANTVVYDMAESSARQSGLAAAAQAIKAGRLVAFPTETVYGLGANALDPAAVLGIFAAKERPADNPLIVHIPDLAAVRPLVAAIPDVLAGLAERFWPGPLTVVLPKSARVPACVTADLDTVALRVPDHPVALALLAQAGLPIAAPSANRSGRPSPTRAEHVWADLAGKVTVILDGGPAGIGVESTVLDLTAAVPTVLRPGGVAVEQLAAVLGEVRVDPRATAAADIAASAGPVRSPGMKYKHYAPLAPATLVEGEPAAVYPVLWRLAQAALPQGRVGLLLTAEGKQRLDTYGAAGEPRLVVQVTGPRDRPDIVARTVYAGLRAMDDSGVASIFMEGLPTSGLGLAIMNRLRRAAGGRIISAGEGGSGQAGGR